MFDSSSDTTDPQLQIEQINPLEQAGSYSIAGTTNLPDQTQITVSAIRPLQPTEQFMSNFGSSYSVLARRFVPIEQGAWKTQLNLWQIASDGRFQEVWQLDQDRLGMQVQPDPTVIFLVTLDPANQPKALQQQIESQGEASTGNLVQFNTDGELYLQTSKTIPVALPSGRTSSPIAQKDKPLTPPSLGEGTQTAPPDLNPTQTDTLISPEAFIR
jgi:hypothetical protein